MAHLRQQIWICGITDGPLRNYNENTFFTYTPKGVYGVSYESEKVCFGDFRANMYAQLSSCHTTIDTKTKLGTNDILYRSLAYLTFTHLDLPYAVWTKCLFMHDPLEPFLRLLSGFCIMFTALLIMWFSCICLRRSRWLLIQMQIRSFVLLLVTPLLDIVCFLAQTF